MSSEEDKELKKLIELAQKPGDSPQREVDPFLDEAQRFVEAMGLEDGRYKVPSRTLFELYQQWSKKPSAKRSFFDQLSKIFIALRTEHKRYYKLNKNAFQLSVRIKELKAKNERKY